VIVKMEKIITRYANGQLKEIYYMKNGKKEGIYSLYYVSGQLKKNYNYVNDKIEGKYLYYYENGYLHVKCNYVSGKINGEYLEYYDNGKIKVKCICVCICVNNIFDGVIDTKILNICVFDKIQCNEVCLICKI